MARIGFFVPPFLGYLNPMSALASTLVARGHAAVVIAQADVGPRLRDAAIGFCPVGHRSHPLGHLADTEKRMGRLNGPIGMRRLIGGIARTTDMLAGEGAPRPHRLGVEAIVSDQLEPVGALVAEHLALPYVLAEEIAAAGGVARAADIVERVIATGRPVMRQEFSIP